MAPADKIGNGRRLKSTVRDAQFWPEFRAVRDARILLAAGDTSVTYHPPSSPLSISSPPRSTSPSTPSVADKFNQFMLSKQQPLESLPVHHKKPAAWRDLSFAFRALYLHDAGESFGPLQAFTLRFNPAIEKLARAQPSAASWLQKRMAVELKKSFGRPVEFWFVLEHAGTGAVGLHLHGELVLPPDDATAARAALRRAGGVWVVARQHQAKLIADPDAGWVGYVMKDEVLNRKPGKNAGSGARMLGKMRKFSGDHHAYTRALGSAGRVLYDADRSAAIDRLKQAA